MLTETPISSKKNTQFLHKYVIGLLSLWLIFVGTFPLACWRVSRTEKFTGMHLKSLSWQEVQRQ
jgi:hypothetical protein